MTIQATPVKAYVVIDGDSVCTYNQLREYGFEAVSMEATYLAGHHGINGLMHISKCKSQRDVMDDHGLALAVIEVPYFSDKRFAMEPEVEQMMVVEGDDGDTLDLETNNGFVKLVSEDVDEATLSVFVKPSSGFYHHNTYLPSIDIFDALGWNEEEARVPAMPSPEEVLRQMNSTPNLADQFEKAFAPKAAPKPVPTPSWSEPQPKVAPEEPVKKNVTPKPTPTPVNSEDILTEMFGLFLKK